MVHGGMTHPLALEPNQSDPFDFTLQVAQLYAALIAAIDAASGAVADMGLGGKLLYAGELDAQSRTLVVASNIAGAATLTATADQFEQKQAVRDGVVDFLVTSLDEALRILKNQVRKHETVAVCVADYPQVIVRQMQERGVQPDFLAPGNPSAHEYEQFITHGARQIQPSHADDVDSLVAWSVSAERAQWLPKLDAIALGCLDPGDWPARRWLRFAPRYLGRLAHGLHLLACNPKSAERLVDAVRNEVDNGNIPVSVEILVRGPGPKPEHRLRLERP
jgi:hypothetical protein